MTTEIIIERPDINTVAIVIKSDEVYKNTTLLLSPDEANLLASKINFGNFGHLVAGT